MLRWIDFNFLNKSLTWIFCCCETVKCYLKRTENILDLDLR